MIKILILILAFFISCTQTNNQNIKKITFVDLPELKEDISKLGVNDVIEITVYDETNLSRTFRIDTSGKILFPLIGEIEVVNRKINEIVKEIETKLSEKYLKNPQVTIFVKETNSKKVYIFGQISKPGSYSYQTDLTLLQLIATSGGFTQIADKSNIILKRNINNNVSSYKIPVNQIIDGKIKDIILIPNDIIYVSETWL